MFWISTSLNDSYFPGTLILMPFNLLSTGEYIIKIQDATDPPFCDQMLEPAYLIVRVTAPKKQKTIKKKDKDKGPK